MKSMAESEGVFTKSDVARRPCPKCAGEVRVQLWESSCGGYEDEKYTCTKCGHVWWVDGSDS